MSGWNANRGVPWGNGRVRSQVDPFQTLQVQLSLARLEREIERLRSDETVFARAHHLRAAVLAYGHLLGEACRLAGVEPVPAVGSSVGRLLAVAELQARGWDW